MAVDGRKLRDTLRHGSDVYNEHPCSPCAKDNRQVEAIKYCVDCDENICGKCESDHKRFAVMRGHQIEDKPRTQAGQNRLDLPTTRCDKHKGKLADVYCPSHDTVGCSTCVAVEHSACQGMQYIPNVAKGVGTSKELKDLEIEMKNLQKRLDSLKLKKQGHMKQLQQDKDMILKEIKHLRKRINDHLDKMENTLLDEIDILFDQRIKDTVTGIKTADSIKSQVDKHKKTLHDAGNVSDAELFIQLKNGYNYIKENRDIVIELDRTVDERSMQFQASKEIEKFLKRQTSFGCISFPWESLRVRKIYDIDVSLPSDKETCDITGVCLIENGEIIITDFGNNRLKKLSNTFAVTAQIVMPDKPYGVCKVDKEQLVVTLINDKRVQFVSQTLLKLGNSFGVGDRCRGIACHDCCVYVCCGGKQTKDEGPGRIEVYSLNGEVKRIFYEGLKLPISIRLNNINLMTELIVSNCRSETRKIVIIDLPENTISKIKIKELVSPTGVCVIGCDHLCVLDRETHNVAIVTKDGQMQEILLSAKDGIIRPEDVLFDNTRSLLIVTMYKTNTIKVCKLTNNVRRQITQYSRPSSSLRHVETAKTY